MEQLTERFELLLTESEKEALAKVAKREGMSMGNVLRNALRTLAKRKKCWHD